MHFHRPRALPKNKRFRLRIERGVRNRREKKALVEKGCSHGILVYVKGKPIGWCQYGPREELPRIDNSPKYLGFLRGGPAEKLWRITCFVVDRKHRRRGAASAALRAALEAIRKKGGGLVEAYPIIPWEELCRARIRRCGLAPAFGNESTHGTMSMFEKQGFTKVARYGYRNVLMRRTI
jgi:GNAT superfamily N-acetyltransferase